MEFGRILVTPLPAPIVGRRLRYSPLLSAGFAGLAKALSQTLTLSEKNQTLSGDYLMVNYEAEGAYVRIIGAKHTKHMSTFLWHGDSLTIISGFPSCPDCGYTLDRQWAQDVWTCLHCKTVWSDKDFVQAIETELAVVRVSVRSLEG